MNGIKQQGTAPAGDRVFLKSSRLVWLWAQKSMGVKNLAEKYATKYGISRQQVWHDMKFDLPAVAKAINDEMPYLGKLVKLLVKPGDLKKVPVTQVDNAAISYMTVNLIIDHVNNVVTWQPYSQVIYDANGAKLARIDYDLGADTRD